MLSSQICTTSRDCACILSKVNSVIYTDYTDLYCASPLVFLLVILHLHSFHGLYFLEIKWKDVLKEYTLHYYRIFNLYITFSMRGF